MWTTGYLQDGSDIIIQVYKYSDVMVVQETSTEENIEAFAEVFSGHSVPKRIRSGNGPPFNGRDSHLLMRYHK